MLTVFQDKPSSNMESEDPPAISGLIRELIEESIDLLCVPDFFGRFFNWETTSNIASRSGTY